MTPTFRRSHAAVCAGVTAALCAFAAQAHIVYGTKTLLGLTAESDLALRGRIVAVDAGPTPASEDAGSSRPGVEAEVLEVLKGALAKPRIRFAQHGHGVAQFEPGDETLIFLVDIARSRELDALGRAGAFEWVSLQEHDDEYRIESATREKLLAAVRGYVAASRTSGTEQRIATLRRSNLALLTSGDARLASSALRDLTAAPSLPLLTEEDVPALDDVLNDSSTSMGVRVALLHELERRGLVDGPPRWLRLLAADESPADRITAIRGASSSRSERVRSRLIALLSDPSDDVAAAAAIALGAPDDRAAVKPLTAALSHESSTVRMAAIRGLGAISGPEAMAALEAAAESHPDPATRRRAQAEVRKREGRSAAEAEARSSR